MKITIRKSIRIAGKKHERKRTGDFTILQKKHIEKELIKELLELKNKILNEKNFYTVRKAIDDYLSFTEDRYSHSTFYSRQKALEKHLSKWFNRELETITKSELKELFISLNGLKPTTKIEVLKYIRQVFELAVENRKIPFNPAKQIYLEENKNKREAAKKLQAMTKSEIARLLSYLKEKSLDDWYAIFFVTYQLGLRSSEAIALQFKDIDFERKQVVISKSWCKRKNGFCPPKNGKSRIIALSTETRDYLLKLQGGSLSLNDFVLPRIKIWIQGKAATVLKVIQKELGIKQTNYHSLRASFITHLLRDGVSLVKVQSMVGHSDLETTQRYIRLDGSDLDGATDSLSLKDEN